MISNVANVSGEGIYVERSKRITNVQIGGVSQE